MGDLFISSLQELAWKHSFGDMRLGIMFSTTLHAQLFQKLESYHGLFAISAGRNTISLRAFK